MEALTIISWIFIALGFLSAIIIYVDINMGRYQGMPIMNIAWVITALYSSVLALFMYFKYGRAEKAAMMMGGSGKHKCGSGMHSCGASMKKDDSKKKKPTPKWVQIYISSTHCGAGCGLADIVSELMIFWGGLTIAGLAIWASFVYDYIFALAFGLAFQYFSIKPMRPGESTGRLIWDALTADIWSLTSFQIGMYAWLLIVEFGIFDLTLRSNNIVFWFMMQIGLTLGLLTTFPVNAWLIKKGIKVPCTH